MANETPVPSILEQTMTLVARHGLTVAATLLVNAGLLDKDASAQFVTIGAGIVAGGLALAWSYWQKRVAAKRLVAAIVAPASTPVTADANKP